MRLFVAVTFPETAKDALWAFTGKMRAKSLQGSFTRRENYHLTLFFIGETYRVNDIRAAMDRTGGSPFFLETGELGCFRRDGGDIWWLGLKDNPPLNSLQRRLAAELKGKGFSPEEKGFRPHLTLGRQVVFPQGFDRSSLEPEIPALRIPVERLSLMKSERIGPRLVYTPIYEKELPPGRS